LENKQFLTLDS